MQINNAIGVVSKRCRFFSQLKKEQNKCKVMYDGVVCIAEKEYSSSHVIHGGRFFCHLLILSLFYFFFKPTQVSSNLYMQLTPLFQFFFQISPANLGGKILPAAEKFCGSIFAAEFSLPH